MRKRLAYVRRSVHFNSIQSNSRKNISHSLRIFHLVRVSMRAFNHFLSICIFNGIRFIDQVSTKSCRINGNKIKSKHQMKLIEDILQCNKYVQTL